MNAPIGQDGRAVCLAGWPGRLLRGLCVALLVAAAPEARAAAMRGTVSAAALSQALQANDAYYRNALAARSLHINVPVTLRALRPMSDGTLPDSAFVDYLRWRWTLNPARFSQYHPSVSRMILQDLQIRTAIQQTPTITKPQIINPPGVKPAVITNPQTVTPPTVPEPSTVLIVGVLFGAGLWARRQRSLRV